MRALTVIILYFIQATVNVESATINGYIINDSTGLGYRIVFRSKSWLVAKDRCEQEGAKLAVPETQEDFQFIQKLVRGMYYPKIQDTTYKLLVWLGINNLDNYKIWKSVDGKNIKDYNFHTWAEGNGEGNIDSINEPRCAGVDAANPGLRNWWCERRQPYVCQIDSNFVETQQATL